MDAQHTPGEWLVGWGNGLTGPTTAAAMPFCGGDKWEFEPVHVGRETIALVPRQDRRGDYKANARLIAAAPDLLDAIRPIAEHGGISAAILKKVIAAYSKATAAT